jgi:lysophospholipase L1-like esterase
VRFQVLARTFLAAAALAAASCEQIDTAPQVDLAVWPGPVPPVPPAVIPRLQYTTFLAFGDSLTEGFLKGLSASGTLTNSNIAGDVDPRTPGPSTGFPFKLKTLLASRYSAQEVVMFDAGWGARTVREDAEEHRLAGVLAVLPQPPEVMLLMHGVNDLMNNGSIASAIEHVQDLVDQAHSRGLKVLVSTLPPERDGGIKGVGNAEVAAYNAALKTQISGATIIDVNPAVTPDMVGPDGLHLLEIGNQTLAEVYFAKLMELYETPQASK